ncbi:MAG: 30S ribosomal protein S6 [Patescibacteria group bacterium]
MAKYEITYLTRTEEETGGVADLISQFGGHIESQLPPLRRRLTYPIKKEPSAVFYTYVFDLENTRISEFDQKLQKNEMILRHLIVADGIRKGVETPRKLREKDLEVAESLAKGMEELAAADVARGVAPAMPEAESVAEAVSAATETAEKPTTPKKSVSKKEVSVEELTSEERQKKLDEKLKSILGE